MELKDYINESIRIDSVDDFTKVEQDAIEQVAQEVQEMYNEGGVDAVREWSERCDEGVLGGVLGFLAGPSIGKIIARALGIREGVFYDLLTSRLVSTALGSSIQKAMK